MCIRDSHPAVSCDLQGQGLPAGANQFIRFHGDRIAHSGGQDKGAARHSDGWPCLISHNSAKSSQWWTMEVFLHAGVQRFPEERRFTEGVSGARDRRHRSRPPPVSYTHLERNRIGVFRFMRFRFSAFSIYAMPPSISRKSPMVGSPPQRGSARYVSTFAVLTESQS